MRSVDSVAVMYEGSAKFLDSAPQEMGAWLCSYRVVIISSFVIGRSHYSAEPRSRRLPKAASALSPAIGCREFWSHSCSPVLGSTYINTGSAAAHCVSPKNGPSGPCGESLNIEIMDTYFGLHCINRSPERPVFPLSQINIILLSTTLMRYCNTGSWSCGAAGLRFPESDNNLVFTWKS